MARSQSRIPESPKITPKPYFTKTVGVKEVGLGEGTSEEQTRWFRGISVAAIAWAVQRAGIPIVPTCQNEPISKCRICTEGGLVEIHQGAVQGWKETLPMTGRGDSAVGATGCRHSNPCRPTAASRSTRSIQEVGSLAIRSRIGGEE
jgi:hypothetical protein